MNNMRDTILIADDQEMNRVILSNIFQNHYHILEAENGEQAQLMVEQYHHKLAVMLLDIFMPVKNGYEVLQDIRDQGYLSEFPVIIITAENTAENEVQAFDYGAADIIMKPFEPHVVKRRVDNIIELNRHKLNQDELIEEQAKKLRESNAVMVDALSSIIEYRSLETGKHIRRIRFLTKILLEDLAKSYSEYMLNEQTINMIASASSLHDIGKIAIPDSILNKPGKLTPEEYEIMKTHSVRGCELLARLDKLEDQEYIQYAYNICRYHHERWDGNGYPDGLKGENIPLCAQVAGIADCYDAMTSDRVYKKAIPPLQVINMILNGECGIFSPHLLESLKNVQNVFVHLVGEHSDMRLNEGGVAKAVMDSRSTWRSHLDANQLGQVKYYTLLKHMEATVVEIDADTGVYHVVYMTGDNLASLKSGGSFDAAITNFAKIMVHPDDRRAMLDITGNYMEALFVHGLSKQSRRYRIYNTLSSKYDWYMETLLRMDTGHPLERKALMVLEPVEDGSGQIKIGHKNKRILDGIIDSIQICKNDRYFTMDVYSTGMKKLLGYTTEEVRHLFQNRYIELIYEPDREHVLQEIELQLRKGDILELEYRMTTKQGSLIWVLDKSMCFTGKDGHEYFYSVIIDITQSKRAQEELRLLTERYQIIMSQSNNIVFEWNTWTDCIVYSSGTEKHSRTHPIIDLYTKELSYALHIYPEDFQQFKQMKQNILGGSSYERMDVRLEDKDHQYRWYKIRLLSQKNQHGQVNRVIGIIRDIDAEKHVAQKLIMQAERDSLTMLYNKRTARLKMSEILDGKMSGQAALFILDIDDFKRINDTYGHLFGDGVLREVARTLESLFDKHNVISRIGGDEFLILMSYEGMLVQVQEKAAAVIQAFHTVFPKLDNLFAMTCSIGISIYPDHGTDMKTLFECSDLALYWAKVRGKDQYAIYSDECHKRPVYDRPRNIMERTGIDSDMEPKNSMQRLLTHIVPVLQKAGHYDDTVRLILAAVGSIFNPSRVYIFEDADDGKTTFNTYEWCNDKIISQRYARQHVPYEYNGDNWKKEFDENGIVYCSDVTVQSLWPEIKDSEQPVMSRLLCAMNYQGNQKGFMGIENCLVRWVWTQDQIEQLNFVTQVLALYIFKHKQTEQLEYEFRRLNENRGVK